MIDRIVLVLRIGLGLVFLAAGGLKIGHTEEFASEIAGFQLLPHALIAPLALLLPFLELMIGIYLVLGLFTRFAAWFAAAEMAVFRARSRRPSCGASARRAGASGPATRR